MPISRLPTTVRSKFEFEHMCKVLYRELPYLGGVGAGVGMGSLYGEVKFTMGSGHMGPPQALEQIARHIRLKTLLTFLQLSWLAVKRNFKVVY